MENINYNVQQKVNYHTIETEMLDKVGKYGCEYSETDVKNICEDVYTVEVLKVFGASTTTDKCIPDTIKDVFDCMRNDELFFSYFKKIVTVFSHLGMEYDDFLHATCSNAEHVYNLQLGTFSTLFAHSTFYVRHRCIVEYANNNNIIENYYQELLDVTVKFHQN